MTRLGPRATGRARTLAVVALAVAAIAGARRLQADTPAPPADRRVVVKGKSIHVLGSPQARVVLVEFGDYQCPFCRQYHDQVFAQLRADYVDTGKIRYVVRDLPIPVHEYAFAAAEAARCAGAQNRFWPMREALIAQSRTLAPDGFAALARSAGVSLAPFEACRTARTFEPAIREDVTQALAVGLDRTPSFVLGRMVADGVSGIVIVGARPYSFFRDKLEKALHGS
ncbi:MAG TPA: thioredoxin domain-containing protein [Vicinamibacteria bacterium]|nr:thioredoxin domain-containing protein [Vicinamibacteria bacterium]